MKKDFKVVEEVDRDDNRQSRKSAKVVTWYNSMTREIFYGIDVKVNGEWCHLMEDDNPLFYPLREGAQKKLKEVCKDLEKNGSHDTL